MDAFQLLWRPDLARRIVDRTNLKLDILKKPRMDMNEFMRLLALQFTMGLKNQGSVATYWDTKHFGKPLPLTPWPCWSTVAVDAGIRVLFKNASAVLFPPSPHYLCSCAVQPIDCSHPVPCTVQRSATTISGR